MLMGCIAQAHSMITIHYGGNAGILSVTAYNGLPWPYEQSIVFTEALEKYSMVPLIPVVSAIDGVYDPCDKSTFDDHALDSALEDWYVRANGIYWNVTDG